MLMAEPSTYDKFKRCHMLTADPSTYDFESYIRGGSYQKVKKLSPLIGVMIKFKVYETHFL